MLGAESGVVTATMEAAVLHIEAVLHIAAVRHIEVVLHIAAVRRTETETVQPETSTVEPTAAPAAKATMRLPLPSSF